MKKLLVTINNKARVNELNKFGTVTYVSDYTNLIGLECHEDLIDDLSSHPLVVEFEDACTGSLQ